MTVLLPDPARFAIGMLTRVPVPAPTTVDSSVVGRGLALGPLVGAVIGLAAGLPLLLAGPEPLGRLLTATIGVAIAAWLTRGLHWDGLADLADGLGSGADPERARAIMRQSDIGPFGVLTLVLVLAVQILAATLLPVAAAGVAGWVLAGAVARLAVAVGAAWWVRAARADGLGALVIGSVNGLRLAVATVLTAGVAAAGVAAGLEWPVALLLVPGIGVSTALALTRVAARRLGGTTGDVLGAIAELATAAALLALALT